MNTTDNDIDLRARLANPDATVRRIAMLDLADWAGDEHADLFVQSLRDTDATVRAEAARARRLRNR